MPGASRSRSRPTRICRFERWNARAAQVSLLALVCTVLIPDGLRWTGPVLAVLVGLTLALAAVLAIPGLVAALIGPAEPQAAAVARPGAASARADG